jgi:hypothetical protein
MTTKGIAKTGGTGPTPSERLLIIIWDHIDQARLCRGEHAAQQLAECALKAIEPPADRIGGMDGSAKCSPAVHLLRERLDS